MTWFPLNATVWTGSVLLLDIVSLLVYLLLSLYYPRERGKIHGRQQHQGAPSVFLMLVGETGEPGENLPERGKNMQTPVRKIDPVRPGSRPRDLLQTEEMSVFYMSSTLLLMSQIHKLQETCVI